MTLQTKPQADLDAAHLFKMGSDFAGTHPGCVKVDDTRVQLAQARLTLLHQVRLEAAIAIAGNLDLELVELGLNGLLARVIAFVTCVVGDGLAGRVTEVVGHFGVEGVLEQRLRAWLEEVVFAEWVFGLMVGFEELVDEFGVDACGLGHTILLG